MGDGWFFKIRMTDVSELETLMDAGRVPGLSREPALMRYLPLTDADRKEMLAAIGVLVGRSAVPRRAIDGKDARAGQTCRITRMN